MNIKQFLLFKACSPLPTELIEHIWSFVKTDAKQTIQEKIQDMYYRKIELVRCMYLKLDNFSNSNNRVNFHVVFNTLKVYTRVVNYMYIQDVERFNRRLYGVKWRYRDRHLWSLIDKIVAEVEQVQLMSKARMARIFALRTVDYNLSTEIYIKMTLSPIIMRMLTIIYSSLLDIKIDELDYLLKYYKDHTRDGLPIITYDSNNSMYSNSITDYFNANN
jgi:hypothetical protein